MHDKNKEVKLTVAFNRMIMKICFVNFSEDFLKWYRKANHMTLFLFLFQFFDKNWTHQMHIEHLFGLAVG